LKSIRASGLPAPRLAEQPNASGIFESVTDVPNATAVLVAEFAQSIQNSYPLIVRNVLLTALAALLAALGLRFLFAESYIAPFPYLATAFSEDFTWQDYEKVNVGMPRQQVLDNLGRPVSSHRDWRGGQYFLKSGVMDGVCDAYSYDGKSDIWRFGAWIGINVCYDQYERVVGKNEVINYD
jgi:hypothetical protein